jgi:hypothetical protein
MINKYKIVSFNSSIFNVVSPNDFVLDCKEEIEAIPDNIIPYCYNPSTDEIVCTITENPLNHPFIYQAQREQSSSLITIPLESLRVNKELSAMFIFSPGRCGSTLMSKVLQAENLASVSEPDFYRQIAFQFSKKEIDAEKAGKIINICTNLLTKTIGANSLIIKLHMQCNIAPLLIANSFKKVKIVFLFRELFSWYASWKKIISSITPIQAIHILKQSLFALEKLSKFHKIQVCSYEEMTNSPENFFLEFLKSVNPNISTLNEKFYNVLKTDSQKDSAVSKLKQESLNVEKEEIDQLTKLWESNKPKEIIKKFSLESL